MNAQEWAIYEAGAMVEPTMRGDEFPSLRSGYPMRLLCRGYHANGGPNIRVWHNFSDGKIGRQFNDGDIEFHMEWEIPDLYPTKRAYREDTDLLFAQIVRERYAYPLSFTNWQRMH